MDANLRGGKPDIIPGGRGGWETDGAMFASRIIGRYGGLARTTNPSDPVRIIIATVRSSPASPCWIQVAKQVDRPTQVSLVGNH